MEIICLNHYGEEMCSQTGQLHSLHVLRAFPGYLFIMIGPLVGEMRLFSHYWWWNVLINISHFSSFYLLGVLAVTSWEFNGCLVEIFVQLGQLIYSFETDICLLPSLFLALASFLSCLHLLLTSPKEVRTLSCHDLGIHFS